MLVTGMLVGSALVGCGGPNEASDAVCLDFARFAKDGQPMDQRWDLITSMSGQIDDADQNLRDAYSGLYLEIDHDADAWFVVAEVFAQACIDNNWRGLRDAPRKTHSVPLARR